MLNKKQDTFVSEYCINGFNATKAAHAAGYSPKSAYSQGQRLLKHPEVAAEVSRRLADAVMTRAEALAAMSDMARADIDDFLTMPGTFPYLDLDKARALGKTHLIKKVKVRGDGGIEIELYDRQSAVRDIGKHHGLWKDGVEITFDVSLIAQLLDALKAAGMDAEQVIMRMTQKAQERAVANRPD